MQFLKAFWNDENGRDLFEYALVMAFIALASAGLFFSAGGNVHRVWSVSNSPLSASNASEAAS